MEKMFNQMLQQMKELTGQLQYTASRETPFSATHWNENGDVFRYRMLRKPARN